MPLNIIIAGAGIAGLVAAISLRHAGHTVVVVEKHNVDNIVGAALNVTPNGGRVLSRLGFDVVKARACRPHHWDILRGDNLQQMSSMPLAATPGHPDPGTLTIHRADLHAELLRLATAATSQENAAWGPPVDIRCNSPINRINKDGDGIILESGHEIRGDLVVGADGLHSVVRDYVMQDRPQAKAIHSGLAAFRFLLESEAIQSDAELAPLLETCTGSVNLLADVTETAQERHMLWYACQGGDLQNFVGIHPSTSATIDDDSDKLKDMMAMEFGHFDPRIKKLIGMSSHIKRWPLFIHEPLPTWIHGRVLLIGDAAHPMLPFGGQGATMAMEDGAALGCLLKGCDNDGRLDKAIASFEALRLNRTARVQILSSTRAGLEAQVADKVKPYLDKTAPEAPKSLPERVAHDFSYDVYAACARQSIN